MKFICVFSVRLFRVPESLHEKLPGEQQHAQILLKTKQGRREETPAAKLDRK